MSAISLNAAKMEYDAAQALLDLQSNIRESPSSQSNVPHRFQHKEDMEKAAKLFLSCIIAKTNTTDSVPVTLLEKNNNKKNVAALSFPTPIKNERNCNRKFDTKGAEETIATFYYDKQQSRPVTNTNLDLMKTPTSKVDTLNRHQSVYFQNKESFRKDEKFKFRDVATQTEQCYQLSQIENMEATIKSLCEKIKSLEAQITKTQTIVSEGDQNTSDDEMDIDKEETSSYEYNLSTNGYDTTLSRSYPKNSPYHQRNTDYGTRTKENTSRKILKNPNVNTKSTEMVPIGDGHASVPSRLLRHINWNSYTSATRKLLTAVFSRRILATHSLTGKPSPAFPNKPAKKKLDPALVNDIVQTVVEKCCVPENVVRTSITTKCADESKMYRTRQKNVKKRKHKVNRENIPPDTSDSEEY